MFVNSRSAAVEEIAKRVPEKRGAKPEMILELDRLYQGL
jgi:hypothetical protein